MTPGTWSAGLLVAALLVAGCSVGSADPPAGQPGTPAPTPSASASAGTGPSTADPAPPSLPPVAEPVSLPALMARDYDGRGLRTHQVLARTDAYTRSAVRFRSCHLRISGVMNVPRGQGPFPVLVPRLTGR